jgi:hypothetical protein
MSNAPKPKPKPKGKAPAKPGVKAPGKPAEGKAPAPPAKKPGFLARLFAWPASISSAGCASCLTGMFLLFMVVCAWVWFLLDPAHVPWRHSMGWLRITAELALVVLIPIALYKAIRVWLEGEVSEQPEIDFAWQAGLEALRENGLSISQSPVFLVLGSSGAAAERVLMRASAVPLRVSETPSGPASLHWYAGNDGIYLFLSDACAASAFAALVEKRRGDGEAADLGGGESPPPAPVSTAAPAVATGGSSRGTVMLDQFVADVQSQQAALQRAERPAEAARADEFSVAPARSGGDQAAILEPREAQRRLRRLEYVCHLLKQARGGICPANGVLVVLPYAVLRMSARENQLLAGAVRDDLHVLQRDLSLRCPVTALLAGMHEDRGFGELVRRVGQKRAGEQRFGQRFDLRMIPTGEPLGALCALLGGVYEDWIHTLFREDDALSRPGNPRLYGLLCRMRSSLRGSLQKLIVEGFGYEPQNKRLPEPIPFSGFYFAATGETEDQQAFVRGVFDKLHEEQEEVEWTWRAVGGDQAYGLLAWLFVLGVLLTLIGSIVGVVMLVWR